MTDLVLSPIEIGNLIDRIATRTAELIQSTHNTQPSPADDLITPKEASELLQCSMVSIWRYEKKGRITAYGIGGKKYFKRSEILNSIVKK
ncbi:MAG: helix-turn-helix domain-containing protein [Aequorivita sp.]